MLGRLIQPNPITTARYQYTVWEKRILYVILSQLQSEMQKNVIYPEPIPEDEIDLRQREFTFYQSQIDPEMKNHKRVKEAIQLLQKKSFFIQIGSNVNEGFIGSLVSLGGLLKGKIKVAVPLMVVSYLIDITRGFTAYSGTVAISLSSPTTMRLYELCSRFRDTGSWYCKPEEIVQLLDLSEKSSLTRYNNLKKLIDRSQQDLKELYERNESDIWFDYTEDRSGRGRGGKVDKLNFNIHWRDKGSKNSATEKEEYYLIKDFLSTYFSAATKDTSDFKNEVLNYVLQTNNFDPVAELCKLAKQQKSPAGYFRSVFKKNYGR